MTWIQTHSGRAFDLIEPRPEDVDISDIAWALGAICRFNGHVKHHYSVAEHCLLVSNHLWHQHRDRDLALAGLLHDAHEAYTGDMASPVRAALGHEVKQNLDALKDRVDRAILAKIGRRDLLPMLHDPRVKDADRRIQLTERDALMKPKPPRPWAGEGLEPLPVVVYGWTHEWAHRKWRRRYDELVPR